MNSPKHVAIIMDGNGRWGLKKKNSRTFGHQKGDQVLRAVSAKLLKHVSSVGQAYRYGGEEFFIFLTNTDSSAAFQIAERIRQAVTEQSKDKLYGPLTISVGLTQFHEAKSLDENIDIADKALYASKQSGRNQTTVS